jgi:hypothetical protein
LGEIKSTLDLVFEKTKNLTLSDEEKRRLAREELDKNLQGLCNKYLDNFFPLSRFKDEVEKAAGDDREHAYQFLTTYLFDRFDLDGDNSLIISALTELAKIDITTLNNLQKTYNAEKEAAKKSFTKKSLLSLQERGLSGSAVVPNPDKIPEWKEFLTTLRQKYRTQVQVLENN